MLLEVSLVLMVKNSKDNIKNTLVLLVRGNLENMHINGLFTPKT